MSANVRRLQAAPRPSAAPAGFPSRWLRLHGFIVPSMAVVVLVFIWFTTFGTWRLFAGMYYFGDVYDSQAASLLRGRLDVPLRAVCHEAFIGKEDRATVPTVSEASAAMPPEADPYQWYEEQFPGVRYHTYFGLAPALLRLPLNALFPSQTGKWSQVMMTAACTLNLVGAYFLLRISRRLLRAQSIPQAPAQQPGKASGLPERPPGSAMPGRNAVRLHGAPGTSPGLGWEEKIAYSLFILLVGLGSTNLFLGSMPFTYHEAILWGGTFALLCYGFVARHLETGRSLPLVLAGACSFLSFLSRPTAGAGSLFCLAVFVVAAAALGSGWLTRAATAAYPRLERRNIFALPRVPPAPAQVLMVILAGVTTVGVSGTINYLKFGAIAGPTLENQVFLDPDVLQRTGGKMLQAGNVRTALASYFGPSRFELSDHFPWLGAMQSGEVFPEAGISGFEPYVGMPVNMPALLVLALVGCAVAFWPAARLKKFRLPILGSLVGGTIVLAAPGVGERYAHDFYPFLVVAGVAGFQSMLGLRPWLRRWVVYPLLLTLVLYGIAANVAVALEYQRESGWAPAERAAQLEDWSEKIDYRVNHQFLAPTSLAVGEFHGEHVQDVVAADPASERIRVLLGSRSGGLQRPRQFPAGSTPRAVAVGDFNGDGRLDLAVADAEAGLVQVLLGNGDGTFSTARGFATRIRPRAVAVGDFNGDGKLDLAVAGDGGVCVLLGRGDGSFQEPRYCGEGQNVAGLVVGDFNGDGKLDLAAAGDSGLRILLGKGDGSFQERIQLPGTYSCVVAGDFNADGKLDLVVAGATGVVMLLGKGDGSFQDALPVCLSDNVRGVAAAAFKGGGRLDLAMVTSGGVWVATGNGDGTFQDCGALSEETCRRVAEGNFRCVAVGDFNGDGRLDLMAGGRSGVKVLWGNGDGTFSGP